MAKKQDKLVEGKLKLGDDIWDQYVPIIKVDKHTYNVYLYNNIEVPFIYSEFMNVLNNATSKDTINIMINNMGGSVDSGLMLLNGITRTKAKTIAKLSGSVASAATIIAMGVNSLEIEPYTSYMAHNYSHGVQGSGNQVKTYVNFTDKQLSKTLHSVYKDFLTPTEIANIVTQDTEIWLTAEEVRKRWKNKSKKD